VRLLPLAFLLTACAANHSVPSPPPTTGALLPAVELRTLDGKPARLDEIARGRPALVSLWATWCDACTREFDALTRLDEAARGAGATVIAIAVGEPHALVQSFVQRRALPYAQLVDERFQLADAIGQNRVPATLVLGRDGRVVYRGGAFDESALAAFRAALADKPGGGGDATPSTGRLDHAAR
jgi:peroxiredoxin